MAVNFGLLQPVAPVSAFFQGQQDVRQQAEQNRLREMQAEKMQYERENALAQREQRLASAAERQAQAEAARQRQQFLTGLGAKMAEGGYKLDRPTLGQMLQFGMQTREDSLIKLATEGLKALDEEDLYQREAAKYGIPTGAAQATSDTGAAPANGLAAPQGVTREQVQNMLRSPVARIREMGKSLVSTLEKPERAYEPSEVEKLTMALRNATPGTPEAKALSDRIRILTTREPREPRPEAPPRTQQVTMNDGTIGIMNMDTGQVTPASLNGARVKGKPSAFAEKTAAQRKQLGLDLDRAIVELTDAAKDGGLIDQSTGSGFGRLVDVGAGFVGEATPGAIAAGKLAPIADLALKMVPRFEGPQSNKDTASYKEAAGQLADSTLPNKIRKAAAKTVVRLMRERKNQFASPEMVSSGAAQDTGVDTNNPLLN